MSVTTVVLACFSDAVAQMGYKVTDLGTLGNDNMSCAMVPDVNRQSSRHYDFTGGKQEI